MSVHLQNGFDFCEPHFKHIANTLMGHEFLNAPELLPKCFTLCGCNWYKSNQWQPCCE